MAGSIIQVSKSKLYQTITHSTAITGLANGGYVITWDDFSPSLVPGRSMANMQIYFDDVHAAILDASGSVVKPDFAITSKGWYQYQPDITALSNGNFVVTWSDQLNGSSSLNLNKYAIRAQIFSPTGTKVGSLITLGSTTGQHFQPAITDLGNGGFATVWSNENGKLTLAQYNAKGGHVGSDFSVDAQFDIDGNTIVQQFDVVRLANGSMMLAYVDNGSRLSVAINGVSHPLLNQSNLNIFADDLTSVAAAALPDGGYAVSIGQQLAIYGQNGTYLNGWSIGSSIGDSSVITLDNGDLVWMVSKNGYSGGISLYQLNHQDGYATIVNNGGNGTSISVSSSVSDSNPSITALADGGYALSYIDASGVLAEQFDAKGNQVSVMRGTAGNDSLNGTSTSEMILGLGGNDALVGGGGNDWFDGGAGNDTYTGGSGDDTYVVDNSRDKILNDGGGYDTVRAAYTYRLAGETHLYNLTLSGSASINGFGNELDNFITGNSGANTLDGGVGSDTLIGGAGNDTFIVGTGDVVGADTGGLDKAILKMASGRFTMASGVDNATVDASAGALWVIGNELKNIIIGGAGADTLDGGSGNDILNGGAGNDHYWVDDVKDVIVDSQGTDTVHASVSWSLGSAVENLVLEGNPSISGTGNSLDNLLIGNAGDNTLDGKAGIDSFSGGAGNDTYVLDKAQELANVTESSDGGNDTLKLTFTSPSTTQDIRLGDNLAYIENITVAAAGLFNLYGNNLHNTLVGNTSANILEGAGGNDTLDGGAGADTMLGGGGDDTYVVDSSADFVSEGLDAGVDKLLSSVSYTLTDNVEHLTLTGTGAIKGSGNNLDNAIVGNGAANILDGGAGNDTLTGGSGNDTLIGGSGTNTLIGGVGADTYIVSSFTDVIIETDAVTATGGVDLLILKTGAISGSFVMANNLENATIDTSSTGFVELVGNELKNIIIGNNQGNILRGGAGNDTITGGFEADTLDGGNGVDILNGGMGNDSYWIDDVKDSILDTGGVDTVHSTITWALGSTMENLSLEGSAAINGTGNALDNQIFGNAGDNVLDGKAGIDTFNGGAGNDVYILDKAEELVNITEASEAGIDTLLISYSTTSAASISLTGSLANLENVTLSQMANGAFDLTGNDMNNILLGNGSANTLTGNGGADTLNGGAGKDILTGGLGDDVFCFSSTLNASTNVDEITDYTSGDKIQLDHSIFTKLSVTGLSSSDFVAETGAKAKDFSDHVIYDTATGNLYYDADGSGSGAQVLFAHLTNIPSLTSLDFIVV